MIWKCGRRHICTIFVVGIFTCCLNWTIFTLFTTNCTSYRSYWSHYMDIGTLRVFASTFSQVVLIQINRAASECKLTLDTNSYAQIDHNWNTTTYQYYVLAGLLICCAYLQWKAKGIHYFSIIPLIVSITDLKPQTHLSQLLRGTGNYQLLDR